MEITDMKKLLVLAVLPFLLVACGKNDGDAYVGKWEKVKGRGMGITISRNGDGYVFEDEIPDFANGGKTSTKMPAVMKDGVLHIDAGIESVDAVIDRKTGHLLMDDEELQRVSR
jgi:hypothetical protein